MHFKKSLIALALTSTLAACGSDSSTPDPVTPPSLPVETVVDGKAIKGVLTNAVVTVFKFVDGNPVALSDDELVEANITTDDNGNYSFTVVDYDGPIKVVLSPSTDPNNPTTMTCDAPAGCGDTAFGQQIDLTVADPDFTLNAISVVDSESNGEVKVNVSALTHLAAELIEADESGVSSNTVAQKSSQIASTFGILGDITQLEPTVTDDASAVAAEDNTDELRYGLINAGIMSALFSGETDSLAVLSSKLAEVAADLVENDGALLVNQDEDEGFELALAEVLEGAADAAEAAAEAIAADEDLAGEIDLEQLETNLTNEQAYQEANVGDDGRADVVVDVPTEGDAVAKAKAMVEDVRLFSHLFDEETTEGAGIKTQGDEYTALLDQASLMIEAEAESFTLLAQVSDALAELSLQYDAGTLSEEAAESGVSIANYLTLAGATGTVTFDEETATGGVLFTIDATSGSETVKLNANAEFSEDMKSIKLTLDGSLESAGALFTLNDGSFVKVNLDTAATRASLEDDSYEGEITSGELELALSLAQKATDTVTNPVTFEGLIKTKLLPVDEYVLYENWGWDEQNQQDRMGYGRPDLETLILPEMLTLSGGFSSLEGDSISATLTVNITNLNDYQAPDFKYIGKEIENVVSYTISDDFSTFTINELSNVIDAGTFEFDWFSTQHAVEIEGEGLGYVFIDMVDLEAVASGEATSLPTSAYITKALVNDAFTIDVSADSNTVTVTNDAQTRTYNVDFTSAGNFTFTRQTHEGEALVHSDTRTYATEDLGLDVDEVTISRVNSFDNQNYYSFIRITPVDENDDGITDYLNKSHTSSDYINEAGILTDATGVPLEEFPFLYTNSYDDEMYGWFAPFNAFTVTNAVDAYKGWLTNARGSSLYAQIDGIGYVETTLSSDEVSALAADSTTMFDGYNTQADEHSSLENEDVFLDVNAALTLEAELGDYQVKIQLSGERTALEHGAFDLEMSYRLPEEEEQRSFTVNYNTKEEGKLSAKNFEGVVLVLEEPDEDVEGTQVLGQILVGPTAIVAATIEDRDGIIVIVYNDDEGTVETL